jgi:hypothetical protein
MHPNSGLEEQGLHAPPHELVLRHQQSRTPVQRTVRDAIRAPRHRASFGGEQHARHVVPRERAPE